MNAFEADVAEALASQGIHCVPQVGCSRFRIDLAAVHPTERGRFVLAIECDGASYHSSYTARDRDRLRQQQLESLGWRFHRIWSTDWFLNKSSEVSRVVDAFRAAVEAPPLSIRVEPFPVEREGLSQHHQRPTAVPMVPVHETIEGYVLHELHTILRWVRSDGMRRTEDQEIEEMFKKLPFSRRGARIQRALMRAIATYGK
jgi:very-short-patch-repair endonuclease